MGEGLLELQWVPVLLHQLLEVLCNGCIDGGSHATECGGLILVMLCNRGKVLRCVVADSGGAVNYNAM